MAARSDQLHSHQFTRRRVVAALAMRDADPASPVGSIGGALFASVMVAALALAAVGVYGVLRPGEDGAWRDGGSVIVERESGARFVYRDGVLHPVLNYSSALLILGSVEPRTTLVSRAWIAGVPRGAPLGIPGAPDLLPAARDLVEAAWTLCSRPPAGAPKAGGAESVLLIGSAPPGAQEALGDRAVVASDPAGGRHLVWHNRRHAITDPELVLAALAWPRQSAAPVAAAVLNAIPAGPDLGRIRVGRAGQPSAVDGYRVGQVFVVVNQSGGRQFGVALMDGLADITQVQADLLLADSETGLGSTRQMSLAQYASTARVASLVPTGEATLPATTPQLAPPDRMGGVCASFADGGGPPVLSLAAARPRAAGEMRAAAPAGGRAAVADWVAVPPGRGAVVEALAGPAASSGALCVVSELGVRHPVPSRDVLTVLGYRDVRPQRLPAALVALLPEGLALDPVAAGTPAASGG